MKRLFSLLLLLGLWFYSSCGKKNDPVLSRDQLIITPKGWIVTAITINPPISIPGAPAGVPPISDFFSTMEDCSKDDVFIFTSDSKYKQDEGATKCDPSDPQVSDHGTWVFNSAKTTISITSASGGGMTTFEIVELSSSTLTATYQKELNGTPYTFTITYAVVK